MSKVSVKVSFCGFSGVANSKDFSSNDRVSCGKFRSFSTVLSEKTGEFSRDFLKWGFDVGSSNPLGPL